MSNTFNTFSFSSYVTALRRLSLAMFG